MNKVKNLQEIKTNQQRKYEEIIEYLKQDNGYWLENDKWDLTEEFFIGKKIYNSRYICFSLFENQYLKNELKYYIIYSFKEKLLKDKYILKLTNTFKHFSNFINNNYSKYTTFNDCDRNSFELKFKNYLLDNDFRLINNNVSSNEMNSIIYVLNFFNDFYDDREETEKDIWYSKNIKGVKIPASGASIKQKSINFNAIPIYYREIVKRYIRSFITKKSWMTCCNTLKYLNYFFEYFYTNGYKDVFIENLNRNDIEKYLYYVNNERKCKNATENSKYVSFIRTFLEHIQLAQYEKSPKKEVSFLIFQDDIPKRERVQDEMKRTKFIPEPILKQLDNNIMNLDRPQFIPIYILLRETGWRGTDILNLRYDNCLEQIWNSKEERYNYYLCGEITKTGIAQLKIPIRDKVAEMIQKSIDKAKELSTEENNPKRYLFNTYEGKFKGKPLQKQNLLYTIKRLIIQKDIRDVNGELYHFKLHSLRHTRAKEYV